MAQENINEFIELLESIVKVEEQVENYTKIKKVLTFSYGRNLADTKEIFLNLLKYLKAQQGNINENVFTQKEDYTEKRVNIDSIVEVKEHNNLNYVDKSYVDDQLTKLFEHVQGEYCKLDEKYGSKILNLEGYDNKNRQYIDYLVNKIEKLEKEYRELSTKLATFSREINKPSMEGREVSQEIITSSMDKPTIVPAQFHSIEERPKATPVFQERIIRDVASNPGIMEEKLSSMNAFVKKFREYGYKPGLYNRPEFLKLRLNRCSDKQYSNQRIEFKDLDQAKTVKLEISEGAFTYVAEQIDNSEKYYVSFNFTKILSEDNIYSFACHEFFEIRGMESVGKKGTLIKPAIFVKEKDEFTIESRGIIDICN